VCLAFTWEEGQKMLEDALEHRPERHKPVRYFSDDCPTYRYLMYPGRRAHQVAPGKSQTYTVEGTNADLRHYLARLTRRSRCFTRSPEALRCAVRLFQCAYNQRQLWKHEKKLKRVPGLCDCLAPIN
jgi:IS1 family transposase